MRKKVGNRIALGITPDPLLILALTEPRRRCDDRAMDFRDPIRDFLTFQLRAVLLAVGVLRTLIMRFQPTRLWNMLTMMALIGSGDGLMFRSLRGYVDDNERKER
jgi:hypothetical protein